MIHDIFGCQDRALTFIPFLGLGAGIGIGSEGTKHGLLNSGKQYLAQ